MACITQTDMDKLEFQVLQYNIHLDKIRGEYQAEYNKRGKGVSAPSGADPRGEQEILARFFPILNKRKEAEVQLAEFKKLEICEDIEQRNARLAQTVATERIQELEEQLKSTEKEFSPAQAKQKTLTDQYIIIIAVIVLIGILLLKRRRA